MSCPLTDPPDTPPLGLVESESGNFRVATNVRPLEFYEELVAGIEEAPTGVPSVLGRQSTSGQSPLRIISVAVSWNEGVFERRLERTTFALDRAAAEAALAGLSNGGRRSNR